MANGSRSVPSPVTANFCQGLEGMRISCVRPRDKIAFALYAERVRDTALGGGGEAKKENSLGHSPRATVNPPAGTLASRGGGTFPVEAWAAGALSAPQSSDALARRALGLAQEGSAARGLRKRQERRPEQRRVSRARAAAGPGEAMKEARVQEQPGAAQARPAKGTEAGEAGGRPAYLTTLPAALIRFRRFQKKKRAKSPIFQKGLVAWALNDSLEGPRGLGCIVIPCCQRFNNVRCFVLFYCGLSVCLMVFGLVDVIIANFQKGYYLKIIEESVLQFSYDISSGLIAIFVAHCGGRAKRTTWMAVSSFLIGVGSLFFAFPFFNNRNYEFKVEIE
ncbi:PREDICTED: solute carrier organic anion transporter family member 6A1-like, partial [Galeopterus variegatus]|uniref:Solute carrier organic anion transporter family member 6A1-like n=1 Tax=Galeopterus variegatus TaxID=482537 RepID=A0ABM0PZB0_GALVR